MKIGIIGSDGIPARYGGFETFVEQVAPHMAAMGHEVVVVGSGKGRGVDAAAPSLPHGVTSLYLPLSANGVSSIPYDVASFLKIWRGMDAILVLGVSAGIFMPCMRVLAGRRPVVVNVDGLEARRAKWKGFRKKFLAWSESVAIRHADVVVCDNEGIRELVDRHYPDVHSVTIAYGGDHTVRLADDEVASMLQSRFDLRPHSYALSIARIEPENHIGLMIDAFLASRSVERYVLVGNFSSTEYGRHLKAKHGDDSRVRIIDALYDARLLAALRSGCQVYLHGHSVGGTNPSLVEMLPYSRPILAFDCVFNRYTLAQGGGYFRDASMLRDLLAQAKLEDFIPSGSVRDDPRYTWRRIAEDYVRIMHGPAM